MQCAHNGTPTEQEAITTVLESTRELLDKGYITAKGAIFFGLLSLKDVGVEEVEPRKMMRILGISKSMFYRAKREIEEQEGWRLSPRSVIQLRRVTPPQD